MSVAAIIKEQIKNGKTLTGFAKELGLSHSTLSHILKGKRNAGGKVIRALVSHPDTRDRMLSFLSENVTGVNINSNDIERGGDDG
jgi:transcriptional regulator with XRE-family HTH domain